MKPAVVSITSVKVFKHNQPQHNQQKQKRMPNERMPNDRHHQQLPPQQQQRRPGDLTGMANRLRNLGTFRRRLFDKFLKPRYPEGEYKLQGLGSGIIIDSEKGYIITNNHVVEDADELKITMGDKRI